MPPDQPAQPTALVDPDGAAGGGNGTVGADAWPAPTAPPILAPPAESDTPILGRRERREQREHETRAVVDAPAASALVEEVDPPTAPAPAVKPRGRTKPEAPVKLNRAQRKAQYRMRARKVRRIVRRVDPWGVLKVSVVFYLCMYVVAMVAGVILWRLADNAGAIENVEKLILNMGAFETFQFEPDLIFEGAALIGAVLVVVATGLTVLAAVLFNLISDLVGGIRMTVIEEDGARPIGRERKPKAKKKQKR